MNMNKEKFFWSGWATAAVAIAAAVFAWACPVVTTGGDAGTANDGGAATAAEDTVVDNG